MQRLKCLFFLRAVLLGTLALAGFVPNARGGDYAMDWSLPRPWPFNRGEDPPGKPDRIVELWTDTILTRTGQPAQRGFGGRLMFYEGKGEEPVKVEGMLVVYAFDETDRDPANAKPDRKFVFLPDQMPAHYSKSKLGHSYSVWVPWDEVGGMQKEISLVVRFEPKEGAVVVSEKPKRLLLPGVVPPKKDKPPVTLQQAGGMQMPNMPMATLYSPNGNTPGGASLLVGPGGMVNPNGQNGYAAHAYGEPGAWGNNTAGGVQQASFNAPNNSPAAQDTYDDGQPRKMVTTTIQLPSDLAARAGQGGYAGGQFQGQNFQAPPNYQPQGNFAPNNFTPNNGFQQRMPGYAPPTYSNRPWTPPGYNAAAGPNGQNSMYQSTMYQSTMPQPPTPQGLQLRAGFSQARQQPLGAPLSRLNRDRAPSPPSPSGSPYGPQAQPAPESQNGVLQDSQMVSNELSGRTGQRRGRRQRVESYGQRRTDHGRLRRAAGLSKHAAEAALARATAAHASHSTAAVAVSAQGAAQTAIRITRAIRGIGVLARADEAFLRLLGRIDAHDAALC